MCNCSKCGLPIITGFNDCHGHGSITNWCDKCHQDYWDAQHIPRKEARKLWLEEELGLSLQKKSKHSWNGL